MCEFSILEHLNVCRKVTRTAQRDPGHPHSVFPPSASSQCGPVFTNKGPTSVCYCPARPTFGLFFFFSIFTSVPPPPPCSLPAPECHPEHHTVLSGHVPLTSLVCDRSSVVKDGEGRTEQSLFYLLIWILMAFQSSVPEGWRWVSRCGCFLHKHEAEPESQAPTEKPNIVTWACNPRVWGIETGRSRGLAGQNGEFRVRRERPCHQGIRQRVIEEHTWHPVWLPRE